MARVTLYEPRQSRGWVSLVVLGLVFAGCFALSALATWQGGSPWPVTLIPSLGGLPGLPFLVLALWFPTMRYELDSETFLVRPYEPVDETGWVRCRVLAFLDTAYFDDVYREKERYASRAIELVAEVDGLIVGLLDIECEEEPGTICSKPIGSVPAGLAGMIWHLAVHPDYRQRGIARLLLQRAVEQARQWQIRRFEAWTRDDAFVNEWYRARGFQWVQAYTHVYMSSAEEIRGVVRSELPDLRPVAVFAHYLGDDEGVCQRFARVHRCNRYDLVLG